MRRWEQGPTALEYAFSRQDYWRHADGSIRTDHMDCRPGDYYGPPRLGPTQIDRWVGIVRDIYAGHLDALGEMAIPGPPGHFRTFGRLEQRHFDRTEQDPT